MDLIGTEKRNLSRQRDEVGDVINTAEAAGLRFWIDQEGSLRIDLSKKSEPLSDSLILALVANEDAIRKRMDGTISATGEDELLAGDSNATIRQEGNRSRYFLD